MYFGFELVKRITATDISYTFGLTLLSKVEFKFKLGFG